MTIPRPPSSIQDTAFFRKIASVPSDVDGLFGKAGRFVEIANPLLDSIISGPFRHYTLHNRDHAKKLLHLAEHITSKDTIDSLSPFECLLFLYAAYLHDMGMAISESELNSFVIGTDLAEVLNSWPQLRTNLLSLRLLAADATELERPGIEMAISELHQIAATSYFRPKHATPERYRELLTRIRAADQGNDIFRVRGVSFEDELIDICVSHNLGAEVLGELRNAHEDRFERRLVVADHIANTQFIAALLRLSDILDFDFERTPRILFDSLGLKNRSLPGSEVSLAEWQKHLAVQQLELRESELIIRAKCKHPAIEAAVHQFSLVIEDEIRTTLSVTKRNQQDIVDRYRFRLPANVRCEIRSDGYKFLDISLSLDESAVMSLLMGTSLYRTPYAAIRELIQNSVDACKVRMALRPDLAPPSIRIAQDIDNDGRHWITVRDEGIGMDEYVLKSYFFKVGRSYYTSSDFDRLFRSSGASQPALASRFGIGFLACFMLTDLVEIETLPLPLQHRQHQEKALRVSIERLGALAYVQEVVPSGPGTSIKLRLRHDLGDGEKVCAEIFDYVKTTVVRPGVPIAMALGDRTLNIKSTEYFELAKPPRPPEGIPRDRLRVVQIPMEKYSGILHGRVFLIFLSNEDDTVWDVRYNERLLSLDKISVRGRLPIPLHYIFGDFTGNRVTVGGFRMQLAGLGKILRYMNLILPAAFDIDIAPGLHVEFDVARTRISDESMRLRLAIKTSIRNAVEDIGVWNKLPDDLKRTLAIRIPVDPFSIPAESLRRRTDLVLDEGLLSRVAAALPHDAWPVSVHRAIATHLQIPTGMAFHAISTLILEGRVKNPNVVRKKADG